MRTYLFIMIALMTLIALSGCTDVQQMNLSVSFENETQEPGIPKTDENETSEITTNISEIETEAPIIIDDYSEVYIDPENLVKKLCPEQVLLGLRKCKKANGDLNITIKNAGYRNITMIFYLLYQDDLVAQVYFNDPFVEKEEKTYTIDFDGLEQQYGEITKIQATPVLVEGLEAISCQNKKLPIIVSSGCN